MFQDDEQINKKFLAHALHHQSQTMMKWGNLFLKKQKKRTQKRGHRL